LPYRIGLSVHRRSRACRCTENGTRVAGSGSCELISIVQVNARLKGNGNNILPMPNRLQPQHRRGPSRRRGDSFRRMAPPSQQ